MSERTEAARAQLRFPVLDHGYVQLIDWMGDDNSPLENARMSTGKATGVDVTLDDRLRERLWRDSHVTPFQCCVLIVELQLPIFCLRQIDRHRTIKYDELTQTVETIETVDETMREFTSRNEFSGRYSTMPDLFYIPKPARVKRKGVANKQGSAEPLSPEEQNKWTQAWVQESLHDRDIYDQAVKSGMASELARIHLPLNQYTKVRIQADLLNWLKFLNLRLRSDVQWETRVYAQAIGKIVRELWPKTWKIFEEHTLYGARVSRRERQELRRLVEVAIAMGAPDFYDKMLATLGDTLGDTPDLLEME